MSLHEYLCSQAISKGDPSFYALLFALMRKADTCNVEKIKLCWPEAWEEMQARYNAPSGVLEGDNVDPKALHAGNLIATANRLGIRLSWAQVKLLERATSERPQLNNGVYIKGTGGHAVACALARRGLGRIGKDNAWARTRVVGYFEGGGDNWPRRSGPRNLRGVPHVA